MSKVWQIPPIHLLQMSLKKRKRWSLSLARTHYDFSAKNRFDDSCSQECILKSYVYEGKERVTESIYYFIIICSYFLLVQRNNNTQLRLWTVSDYILRISHSFLIFLLYISHNNPLVLLLQTIIIQSSSISLTHSLTHSHDNIIRRKEKSEKLLSTK